MDHIYGVVEGPIDEAVLTRITSFLASGVAAIHTKHGKSNLLAKLQGYNSAARISPWVVLVDLDNDSECAPEFLRRHLFEPAPYMMCRVAVRAVESWLLGDAERLADFLSIARERIPGNPDSEQRPKRLVVDLARSSRRREIREDMAPRQGSGRDVGPAYTSRMIEFISQCWRPEIAAQASDSLSRCLKALRTLA